MASTGILGGTFNPPHVGHHACALHALEELGLERLLLMPAALSPGKGVEDDPGVEHRLAMCELLASHDPRIAVSRVELDREGPSYTVDTLRSLHDEAPDRELILILGGDTARALPGWRQPEEIARLATLAVAERPGVEHEQIVAALDGLVAPERLRFLDMPLIEVSSTWIRERVGLGEKIEHLVPDDIAAYIAREGLYSQPPGRGDA